MCAHKYRSLLKRLDFLKDSDDSLLFAFLVNLRPFVVTPGQIIFFEAEVAKGMFIIQRGIIELFSNRTKCLYEKITEQNYFAMESLFFKTARSWCTAIARGYTDLTILPIDAFYMIIYDFPKEADKMRRIALKRIETLNLFGNDDIFRLIRHHSSRSVGRNFEDEYTPDNIVIQTLWGTAYKKLYKTLGVTVIPRLKQKILTPIEEEDQNEAIDDESLTESHSDRHSNESYTSPSQSESEASS
jgi:CRP-like cAMP-binding protein